MRLVLRIKGRDDVVDVLRVSSRDAALFYLKFRGHALLNEFDDSRGQTSFTTYFYIQLYY